MELLYTSIAFGIFTAFIIGTCKKLKRVPYCISDTYYALDKDGNIFTQVMFCQAVLLALPIFRTAIFVVDNLTAFFLGLPILLGVLVVAMSPDFKNSIVHKRLHFIGAIVAMVGSLGYTWIVYKPSLLVWIPIFGWWISTKLHKHKSSCKSWEKELLDPEDWLWWLELGLFYSLYICLFVKN